MDQIKVTQQEINALLERVEIGNLQAGDSAIIKSMANAIVVLSQAVNDKAASIKRLLTMLFGAKTEKKDNVLKDDELEKQDKKSPKPKPKKKKKGHGKRAASDYTGADRNFIHHEELKPKETCPLCPKGKVYRMKDPGVVIYLNGQPPIDATIYELEKLRCNLCGKVFTAAAPERITGKHYDETAKAMMAVLKYGYGFPWYRLEKLQENLGIPLPASTQWEKTEAAANLIYPAFDELVRQAAQGDIIHNDDTTMKILDLVKENKTRTKDDRTGMFTTGIISKIGEDKRIAIFYTGRNHAGENIACLYQMRDKDKAPPVQMCDALSRNTTSDFKIILSNCMSHARRNFVEVVANFPDECRYVIEILAEVYHIDAQTKKQNMTPDQRLAFHKEHSTELMTDLRSWLYTQMNDHLVEPNSELGKAINYMINHWPELTQFLKVPGAPLDNNICERALKRCIQHRKNSLFYRTEHGAYIGDLFMSLIHTCNLMNINSFDYLIALQKNSARVFKNPSLWMPWNYEAAMP